MNDGPYLAFRRMARVLLAPFVRLHVWHVAEATEATSAAVLVANHISHFDPLLISLAIRRPIDWMTTQEFYANRLAAAWLRAVNTFPVDRFRVDRRALWVGAERLRLGRWIGIFPEGGIRAGETSILGGAVPKRGAAALARLSGAPLVPCIILGSDRLYRPRRWWPGPPRTPVWVAVGAAVAVAGLDADEADARLAGAMRELSAALVAHFHLGPDDLPTTPQRRKGRDAAAGS